MSRSTKRAALAGLAGILGMTAGLRAQTLIGPTSYLSFANSPFNATNAAGGFTYFHLETFEDGLLNTPGVSADTGTVLGPGGLTDSVDGDDGSIDGSGLAGHSFVFGASAVNFTFSAATLGALPTHVGIVWTDGGNPTFEAFDALGLSIGTLSSFTADGSNSGTTGEDRFFGVINSGGISRISISAGTWELDHLQYGRATAIPEPTTWAAIAGVAALALTLVRRRRPGADA